MIAKVGCHVSIAGGVWNAPKNAAVLGCEIFQIFTRSPQGGPAPIITEETVKKFKGEMEKYSFDTFVVHCPYFINFGSKESRIYHGSAAVVKQELERSSLLGAKYVMTHLGTAKDLGQKKAFEQTKKMLTEVLEGYKGNARLLLEISAGTGAVIGDTFEELHELTLPLRRFETFGGICFDTQHAFASGYDLRTEQAVKQTFSKFEEIIGLKYLKMSHINDSKIELAGRKDRHEHIGEGLIGVEGFEAMLSFLSSSQKKYYLEQEFPLILETEHDKVKLDLETLTNLRNKAFK